MKKTLSLLAAALMTFAVNAQTVKQSRTADYRLNPKQHSMAKCDHTSMLTSINSSDRWEQTDYSYDSQHHLVAVSERVTGDHDVIDSLFYDGDGNIVRLSGWQLLDGIRKNVYYIDYTYDERGNLASRANYNNFSGEFVLGGIYTYSYNDNNQIVLTSLTMSGTEFQRIEYIYNDGKLARELWYSYDGIGLTLDERVSYEYEGGLLMVQRDSSLNSENRWEYNGHHTYFYDEYGNVSEYHYYDKTRDESERSIYHYNYDQSLSSTIIPWHPEIIRPKSYNNTSVIETEEWYLADVDHVLQYVCDYLYTYQSAPVSINEVNVADLQFCPNPATNTIVVEGLTNHPSTLQILDMTGRQVMTLTVSANDANVNISKLPAGCYVIRVISNGEMRTSKLVKE